MYLVSSIAFLMAITVNILTYANELEDNYYEAQIDQEEQTNYDESSVNNRKSTGKIPDSIDISINTMDVIYVTKSGSIITLSDESITCTDETQENETKYEVTEASDEALIESDKICNEIYNDLINTNEQQVTDDQQQINDNEQQVVDAGQQTICDQQLDNTNQLSNEQQIIVEQQVINNNNTETINNSEAAEQNTEIDNSAENGLSDGGYNGGAIALSESDREIAEHIVQAEAGGEGFTGAALVAQTLRDSIMLDGFESVSAVKSGRGYAYTNKEPNDDVKRAVDFIFNQGGYAVKHKIVYFYAPKKVYSKFHESQVFVTEYGGHRFFSNN